MVETNIAIIVVSIVACIVASIFRRYIEIQKLHTEIILRLQKDLSKLDRKIDNLENKYEESSK
jgi:hypothetical protein